MMIAEQLLTLLVETPTSRPHAQHIHVEFHPMSIWLHAEKDMALWCSLLGHGHPSGHHITWFHDVPSVCRVHDGGMTIPIDHINPMINRSKLLSVELDLQNGRGTRPPVADIHRPGRQRARLFLWRASAQMGTFKGWIFTLFVWSNLG